MSVAQDNGTFIKSRHQQHVILHTDKQPNELGFEQLFHLNYLTRVQMANSPQVLYLAASWLVAKLPVAR